MFLHCKLLRHSFCNSASSPNRVTPWLFIGLGNLGEKYQSTKHDVGFDMIDAFAQAQDIPMTFIHFKALFGEGMVGDTPVLLAKPQTYMNLSGESKIIHNAWKTITEMRDSITFKRIKLQRLTQHLKLFSILKGQMASLEELLILKRDHSNSLSGATEALNASTLRLPIVSGAKADILEVKDAVGSAIDMLQAMGSSMCSLLSKVEGVSSFASEITKLVLQEQALLARSRNLLTTLAALHVKQCSIQGHLLQLRRTASER